MKRSYVLNRTWRLGCGIAAVIVVFFLLLGSQGSAHVSASANFQGAKTNAEPPVTGTLADLASPVWKSGFHATDFANFTTREPNPDRTDVFMVFGRDAIYCAFLAEQQSSTILAKQTLNNAGLGLDDYVSLMFDTSGNGTNQYFFETTPLGVRYQAASESSRYNPVWIAKASVEGNRWIGELVIPYRLLRGAAKSWRMNFVRYEAQKQQFTTWAYDAKMTNPFDERFGRR